MSNSSREDSPEPDWLRSFQTPTKSVMTVSSGSESPPDNSHLSEDDKNIDQDDEVYIPFTTSTAKSVDEKLKSEKRKRDNHGENRGKRGGGKIPKQEKNEELMETHGPNHSIWTLSSDPESSPEAKYVKGMDDVTVREDTLQETPNRKSPKKKKQNNHMEEGNSGDKEVPEEEISVKPAGPYVSSSSLPLVLSDKVQRSKALVECEGESIDLSGDSGTVGRVVVSDNPSESRDMFLDLKGIIYKTTIVPSRTFCIVSFGQSEAKIEAIMNDFIQLKPQSNVYEAETIVAGTIDGFSFESEDEDDYMPQAAMDQNDQNEGVEEQPKGKGRGKAEKKPAPGRKKSKSAATKAPPKKVKKKTQPAKKTKAKK